MKKFDRLHYNWLPLLLLAFWMPVSQLAAQPILTFGLFFSYLYPNIRIIFQSPPRWKHSIRILNSALSELF